MSNQKAEKTDTFSSTDIRNWPTTTTHAAEAIQKLYDTHIVKKLEAFRNNGEQIDPEDYVQELRGATVVIEFHVAHWIIGSNHTFNANIDRIDILDSIPELVVPQKCSFDEVSGPKDKGKGKRVEREATK